MCRWWCPICWELSNLCIALVHNQEWHNQPQNQNPTPPTSPLTTTTGTTTAGTPPITATPNTPEPAQNAAGVWHYTCSNGCAGGGGSAIACATCGQTLVHNAAYHQ